jgi:integrase
MHDQRHTYASRAAAQSETLPMIARLLGHRRVKLTARYAHLDDRNLVMAAELAEDTAELYSGYAGCPANKGHRNL